MSKEPLFHVDPDQISETYLRPKSLQEEALYLLRIVGLILSLGWLTGEVLLLALDLMLF